MWIQSAENSLVTCSHFDTVRPTDQPDILYTTLACYVSRKNVSRTFKIVMFKG